MENDDTPPPATTKGKPPGDAFQAWFASMKSGTAKELLDLARSVEGVTMARVLADPFDTSAVVVLVEFALDTVAGVLAVREALREHMAAGARLEVIRL